METFIGLDVSLQETSVCILNQMGTVVFEGKVASEPKAISRLIRKRASNVVRVGLESGPTSVWLTHALLAEGLPLVCLDARHAQAVLSVRPNKSDRSDPSSGIPSARRRNLDQLRPRASRNGSGWVVQSGAGQEPESA
jgi:transposase